MVDFTQVFSRYYVIVTFGYILCVGEILLIPLESITPHGIGDHLDSRTLPHPLEYVLLDVKKVVYHIIFAYVISLPCITQYKTYSMFGEDEHHGA